MPGLRCAVYGCNNSFVGVKAKGEDIKFFPFPKSNNLVSQTIYKEWINRCNRQDSFNPNHSRICSIHFTSNDFERDLKNELLGLPTKKMLNKMAVPTMHLPLQSKKMCTSSREKRLLIHEKKAVVQEILKQQHRKYT
ncbi:THAP domain-containing protein 1-like [Anoplophora glabripennis]|uniref:THAP domain-containing protein 1-like n=1 Tax=Anoplophora glabripennis TaxID=217634 RepID=UPI000874640D|nr:THAP domain-containing protein 1-like [Anoplophora glabripennis]